MRLSMTDRNAFIERQAGAAESGWEAPEATVGSGTGGRTGALGYT